MTSRNVIVPSAALILAALVPALSQAQSSAPGTVMGNGVVTLKKQPEFLRVQVELQEKGKDLQEALAKIKERRDAARKRLVALGAADKAVEFGETQVSQSTERQMMEMMLRDRLRGGIKKPEQKPAAPDPVYVSILLKADLPLKASNAEELLVAAQTLQEKIKAADLGGAKEAKKLTPEEQELAEELAGLGGRRGGSDGPQPGEPLFVFVCKISDAEREKALAEAFQKARQDAARLARAAGAELGTLHQLSAQPVNSGEAGLSPYRFDPYEYRMLERLRTLSEDVEEIGQEAIGPQPGKVMLRLSVFASFTLKIPPSPPR